MWVHTNNSRTPGQGDQHQNQQQQSQMVHHRNTNLQLQQQHLERQQPQFVSAGITVAVNRAPEEVIRQYRDRTITLEAEKKVLENQVRSLEEEEESRCSIVETLNELRERVAVLEKTIRSQNLEIEKLQSRIAEQDKKIQEHSVEIAHLQKDASSQQLEISALKTDMTLLKEASYKEQASKNALLRIAQTIKNLRDTFFDKYSEYHNEDPQDLLYKFGPAKRNEEVKQKRNAFLGIATASDEGAFESLRTWAQDIIIDSSQNNRSHPTQPPILSKEEFITELNIAGTNLSDDCIDILFRCIQTISSK